MLILLANDDGIYAPGLVALENALRELGDVCVVAPASEQSGVSHSITYLTPIIAKEVYFQNERWGWAVEGTPADCVKMGISEFCDRKPDLVVSGINSGMNAGINVLYSGTMAAAIEGAFFGITSIAVSLEFDENAGYDRAARIAVSVIRQILEQKSEKPQLFNLNIPTAALEGKPEVRVVPMDVKQYWEKMERRIDPFGRAYYWVTGGPHPKSGGPETDLSVLFEGNIALTPLHFNMTEIPMLETMQSWSFNIAPPVEDDEEQPRRGPQIRFSRTR